MLSTTGGRRHGTHRHSSSFPAVATARSADAAVALAARCQTKPSPLLHKSTHTVRIVTVFTFWAVKSSNCCCVRSHSHITTAARRRALDSSLPVAMTRGGSSPVRSGGWFLYSSSAMPAVVSALLDHFLMNSRDGGTWEPDVPAVEPVEHQSRCAIRATETEWHRNRSVATSRGAWLPALICMGGFAQRQERHERRSCWML